MRGIALPYYNTSVDIHVEEDNLSAVLRSRLHDYRPQKSGEQIVCEALASPVGTPRLSELSRGKNNVLLITSDHTRAVPSRITLPLLLKEIRRGNPGADITILIATGLHRATTLEEQRRMFGDGIVKREKIAVHDAFQKEDMVDICTLPSGASFCVNKLVTGADLIVCEGFIEPHFFAGFSGGRKSILPGVCSQETINENHSARAIAHKNSKSGMLEGNVIH